MGASKSTASAPTPDPDPIRAIFDSIDSDKSNELSLTELTVALSKLKLNSYHSKEIFDACDTDHNGKISFPEFSKYCGGREKELSESFKYWDRENTGTITKNDLHNLLADLGLHPTTTDLTHLTSVFTDKDEISYPEFRDTLLLLKACDFSKISDEWMHHTGEVGGDAGGGTNKDKGGSWQPALSGGIAASISRTVVAPLERLRMQMITDGAKFGGSTLNCAKSILTEEGVKGMWRGNGVNMLRILPQNAIAFSCKVSIKNAVNDAFGGLAWFHWYAICLNEYIVLAILSAS